MPRSRSDRSPAPRSAALGQTSAVRQGSLREMNLVVVTHAIFGAHAPPSRARIAAETGLTRATVSTLVDQLIEARLVRELPVTATRRAGRPATPLGPAGESIVGLGLEVNVGYLGLRALDLTGTVVAASVETGLLARRDPGEVLGRLGAMARTAIAELRDVGMTVAGARLALPGLVDSQAGRLQLAPNLGWSDLDPVPLLGLEGLEVRVANEAKLAGLAQTAMPAGMTGRSDRAPGEDADPLGTSFVYISGDVGIGSATIHDGALLLGEHGWSGEIGHVVVDPAGPPCTCGARGCLEKYAGRTALMRGAGLGPDAPVEALLDALAGGHPSATAALETAGGALGSALADLINLVDIETVVLGGIYTSLFAHLHAHVDRVLAERVLAAPWTDLRVLPALETEDAALTGGARQVLRDVLNAPSSWVSAPAEAPAPSV